MARKLVIWIVDDMDIGMAPYLERELGVTATWFGSGEAVLEALDKKLPDLLILDWILSSPTHNRYKDGRHVLAYLETRKIRIPVIVISGAIEFRYATSPAERIYKGKVCWMDKPIRIDETIECINKYLNIQNSGDE